MLPTIKKSALFLGLTAVLAFAFVPFGCGSVQPVAQAPESIAGPIRTCAIKHTRHLGATDHAMTFDVKLTYNGYVDSITLIKSDVGDEELEACVASSIRSLTVEDLPLRSADNGDQELATPQSRMVLGHPAVAAACLASPPCVLGVVVLMGATVITVQIMVHAAATTTKPTATTTAPPIPLVLPRRYPNQTCENTRLDELQAAMKAVCTGFPGETCRKKNKDDVGRLEAYPCSLILARIVAVNVCVAARQKVQDVCFKNSPEPGHEQQIDDLTKGITLCDVLKLVNCAPGHPMAGL